MQRSIPLAVVLFAVVACSSASPPSTAPDPSSVPSPSASSPLGSGAPSVTPEVGGTLVVRAYFMLGGQPRSAGLVPVLREVPHTKAVAAAAMRALLDGPSARERGSSPAISTTVPPGTRLRDVSITAGVATVDLSGEFGSRGSRASALGRLAQVVYTLTQFPSVDAVDFRIEGRPVTAVGNETIVLEGPIGREPDALGITTFEDVLPSIFVDRPAWGAALDDPGRLTGSANTFEAHFTYALLDGSGRIVEEAPITATCGSGCRGTFDITLDHSIPGPGWGVLRVIEGDESGLTSGTRRDYPVRLAPSA